MNIQAWVAVYLLCLGLTLVVDYVLDGDLRGRR